MADQNYLLSLPDEVLINEMLLRYSINDLLQLSQINKRINNICQNDRLWHYFNVRDFNIGTIHQEINNWRNSYIFYNKVLTNSITAIPYVEDALLQKRNDLLPKYVFTNTYFEDILLRKENETFLSSFYQKIIDTYRNAIDMYCFRPLCCKTQFSYGHKLALYDSTTDTFKCRPSLRGEKRILDGDIWIDI